MAAVHHHQCVVIIINAILLRFSTMTDTHNIYIGKKAPAPVLCLSNHTQYTDTQTILPLQIIVVTLHTWRKKSHTYGLMMALMCVRVCVIHFPCAPIDLLEWHSFQK